MNTNFNHSNEDNWLEISDNLLTVELPLSVVRAYAMRPDNSILARACRITLGDEPPIKDGKRIQ
jgi:hypothetical protein